MSRRSYSRGRSRSRPPQNRTGIPDAGEDIIIIRVPPSMTHRISEIVGHRSPQDLQASQGPHKSDRSNQNQNSGNGTGNGNSNSNAQNGSKSENGGRPNSNAQNGSESEQRGRTKSRGPPTNGKKTPNESRSQTQTETNVDGIEEIVQRTKRTKWSNAICCWCGQKGHRALRCPGPPDQVTGQIHACAFCNSRSHISEQCKDNFDINNQKDWDNLERIMLVTRRNLPMLACTISPDAWANAKAGKIYEHCRPWTGDYALKYEAENPNYAKKYVVNRFKEDDVDLGVDPWWASPVSELRYMLTVPKPTRVVDSDFIIFRKRKSEDEEMTDVDSSRKYQRTDGAESNIDSTTVPKASSAPQPVSAVEANAQQEQRAPRDNTFDLAGSFMTNCTNCGDKEHESKDCPESCGNCGSPEHPKDDCMEPDENTCVCQPFPRHISADCTIECNSALCLGREKHRAVSCVMQCCQCGVSVAPDFEGSPPTRGLKRHPAIKCPLKRTDCAHCHEYHVTAHCPSMMTDYPEACKSKYCGIWYCETHCQNCFFNGHKRDKCPNTVIVKADQSFVLKCPASSHPEMVLGAQEHCPACRLDRVAASKARGGYKGGNRGGGQRGGHQNGGNLGKGTGGSGGNRGGGGGGTRGG
ncbi:hypothetical protein BTUL_0018g00050 [Botrytis tulipae]|uniref:CCHC-type domain-containing protein n=1 Tax=Botrytis tulipae TaxID=87230 RepID=A0A4Z1F1F0_9HELO|nr:hypothetical protein BTUL_0018g00050 [Botrytis tulipae]